MKSSNNKFLIVDKGVEINDELDEVIVSLDPEFEAAGLMATVTSGIRTPDEQLDIIKDYCRRKNIQDVFIASAELSKKVQFNGEEIYSWQPAWSKLLEAGILINPPLRAKCLVDYINAAGINRKGVYFNQTIHASKKAFDIGGAGNGVADEAKVMQKAIASKKFPKIKGITIERNNNCVHTDII
jgi:hypothetical protein